MVLRYAGVGSRKTPPAMLKAFTKLSRELCDKGWVLRSGGADGADSAFAAAVPHNRGQKEIFAPWNSFNDHFEGINDVAVLHGRASETAHILAEEVHPVWNKLRPSFKKLHARNIGIMLGGELDKPVDAVICWTPGGRTTGGTGLAIRFAEKEGIPVLNAATRSIADIGKIMDGIAARKLGRETGAENARDAGGRGPDYVNRGAGRAAGGRVNAAPARKKAPQWHPGG